MGRETPEKFPELLRTHGTRSFISNFRHPEMNYMAREEKQFTTRFAPFINERNVIGISTELQEAIRHIEQNANPKFVFFDFVLKIIVWLVKK